VGAKLIVIRGNSASGKSSVAKKLRAKLDDRTALVEQDYLRRVVLEAKGESGPDNVELIFQTVRFALDRGYNVILEGILGSHHYRPMFERLIEIHPDGNHCFYLDVSFEETLRRHATKPNHLEFGEAEMADWYKPGDIIDILEERIIGENSGFDETVELMLKSLSSAN